MKVNLLIVTNQLKMSKSCFLCSDAAVVQDVANEIPDLNTNLNLFLLNQILGMIDFDFSNIPLIGEISFCRPCLTRLLNIQNMLDQLRKLEKKVSYEKYVIEIQLQEIHKRNAFDSQNQKLHTPGGNSLYDLRGEIVTGLQTETIETMLHKIQKQSIGRVKPGRVRIMKDIIITPLITPIEDNTMGPDPDHVHPIVSVEDPVTSLGEKSFQSNETLVNLQTSVLSGSNPVDQTNNVNNRDETETMTMGHTPFEYKLEGCEIKEEPVLYGNFQNSTTPLDPLGGVEHESYTTDVIVNRTIDADSESAGGSEVLLTAAKFICGVCEAHFDNYVDLAHHDKIHLNLPSSHSRARDTTDLPLPKKRGAKSALQVKIECHICSKWLKNRRTLKSHMETHKNKYLRKCSKCGVDVHNINEWTRHRREAHPGKYKCTVCQMTFQRKSHLDSHKFTHSVRKLFKCNICDATCTRYDSLTRHMRIHSKTSANSETSNSIT